MASSTSARPLAKADLLAYAALALPIAIVSLPVYVHIPQFYAQTVGLNLALIGYILLAVRLIDTIQDPLLGWLSDQMLQRGLSRKQLILIAAPILALSLVMLVNPVSGPWGMVWFTASLVLLYSAFSMMSINYYAYGADWRESPGEQGLISTWREAAVIIGILLASLLPQILINQTDEAQGYALFGWIAGGAIVLLVPLVLWKLPAVVASGADNDLAKKALWRTMRAVISSREYSWLLLVFFLNGVANSIPATLILFYISDVLQASGQAGYFLGVYFLAGLAGLPVWLKLSGYIGKKRCLILSMILASISFVFAFCLSPEQADWFYLICLLTGLCLGADMAIPPAMLGDVIHKEKSSGAAGYFGIWNLVWKLSFAFAAGVSLPLLAAMGYEPDAANPKPHAITMLAMSYALFPSAIKFISAILLYLSPIESRRE